MYRKKTKIRYFVILGVPRHEVIGYYQWIPLMLLLQSLCYYLPCIVWSVHNARVGLDINRMVLLISGREMIELMDIFHLSGSITGFGHNFFSCFHIFHPHRFPSTNSMDSG